jgi:peptide methionine sulfoxide reductase MsrB
MEEVGCSKYLYNNIMKNDDAEIILVENFPCLSKDQLHSRERYFIENMKCINKNIPKRSQTEYREINRECKHIKDRLYYQNNKEKLLKKQQEKFICECGGKFTRNHKSDHIKTVSHQTYIKSSSPSGES